MFVINKVPGMRVLEIGGGQSRHPAADVNVDSRAVEGVDFVMDFEKFPWVEISSNEFDAVVAHFLLEHLGFRSTKSAVGEIKRVLKPGGKAICAVPNLEAQLAFALENKEGWDERDYFTSLSETVFGSQNMEGDNNLHRSAWSPEIAMKVFTDAGFENVIVAPYGVKDTDLSIVATKPHDRSLASPAPQTPQPVQPPPQVQYDPKVAFSKSYFDAWGGGYRDWPFFELVSRAVLSRRPESVLELGCGRGYVLKRLQDAGVHVADGIDVSRHCWLTRACDGISTCDVRQAQWFGGGTPNPLFDLAFSFCFFEHVSEADLPAIFAELARTTKRGLHGISFNDHDGMNDPTRVSLHPREWWRAKFDAAGLREHEVVDKVQLMSGPFPPEVLQGDGKVKLNVGSFTVMSHHGWINVNLNVGEIVNFAASNGYQFLPHDVRNGLPQATGTVDAIFHSHFFEHLSCKEGLSFLKECRRAIKPDGAMRMLMPDASLLIAKYHTVLNGHLSEFDEMSDGCTNSPTSAGKLWELLVAGDHKAFYDAETLELMLKESGWVPSRAAFRQTNLGRAGQQILKETIETNPELSLVMEAVPLVG